MLKKIRRNIRCKISSEISTNNNKENKFSLKTKRDKRHFYSTEVAERNFKKKNSYTENDDSSSFNDGENLRIQNPPLEFDKKESRSFNNKRERCLSPLISLFSANTNGNCNGYSCNPSPSSTTITKLIRNNNNNNNLNTIYKAKKNLSKKHDNTNFYINKSGFPLNEETWEQMWSFACYLHPLGDQLQELIRDKSCREVPIPKPPLNLPSYISVVSKVEVVQRYLDSLQYNYTGTQFFDIKKDKPICYLMDYAREMIRASLPIKCLEAVILAVYCTCQYSNLDRFPVSFKSQFEDRIYRHVVLGVHHLDRYGAIGLSRKADLMYKPLVYLNLSDLLLDFVASYHKYGHKLIKIKIGNSVPHNILTCESIQWNIISVNCEKADSIKLKKQIEKSSRLIKKRSADWHFTGTVLRARYDLQTRSNSIDLIKLTRTNTSMPTLPLNKDKLSPVNKPTNSTAHQGNSGNNNNNNNERCLLGKNNNDVIINSNNNNGITINSNNINSFTDFHLPSPEKSPHALYIQTPLDNNKEHQQRNQLVLPSINQTLTTPSNANKVIIDYDIGKI